MHYVGAVGLHDELDRERSVREHVQNDDCQDAPGRPRERTNEECCQMRTDHQTVDGGSGAACFAVEAERFRDGTHGTDAERDVLF